MAPGNYPFSISATGGGTTRTVQAILTVPAPTFNLSSNSQSANAPAGGSVSVTLTVAAANNFNSAIAFSLSTLPAGVTAGFTPATVAAPGNGTSTLKFTVAAGTPAGSRAVIVTATGGGVVKTQNITLVY